MNLEHLKAFVWLRWTLRKNQLRRGGIANKVVLVLLAAMVATAAFGLFVGGLAGGYFGMPAAHPTLRLLIWDGVVVGFLVLWMGGLLNELQRSDPLTLDKFLHLPVRPLGVFLVNYVSSLASMILALFVAAVAGLILGQAFGLGPAILLAVPPVLAFLFALTAMTYQFQGWLAVLMANPRRRRTIIVFATFGFIALVQLPNLFNLLGFWGTKSSKVSTVAPPMVAAPMVTAPPMVVTPTTAPGPNREAPAPVTVPPVVPPPLVVTPPVQGTTLREEMETYREPAEWANAVLPPGWLPLGAAGASEGRVLPPLLGTLGYLGIGAFCLWRAYLTTVRYQTGVIGESAAAGEKAVKSAAFRPGVLKLVEWELPRVPEAVAAVASASLRGLLRTPETKMLLIGPIVMVVILPGFVLKFPSEMPPIARPVIAFCMTAFTLMVGMQIGGNVFGYDRAGFRAYVLAPIPRRQILLGKNLAAAPLTLGLGAAVALAVGVLLPMRWDHYPAVAALTLALFLVYCLMMNGLSIVAPMPLMPGAMKPGNVKLVPVLWQFGFLFAYSIAVAVAFLPLGVEALVEEAGEVRGWPIGLALSLVWLAAAALLYPPVIAAQGAWLARREQEILLVVTSKEE